MGVEWEDYRMSTYRAVLSLFFLLSSYNHEFDRKQYTIALSSKPLAVWGVCTDLPEPAKLHFLQYSSVVILHTETAFPERSKVDWVLLSTQKVDFLRVQRLLNAVVRFAFNLRLIARESPFKIVANMLLIENVCKMVTCCLVHKFLTLEERATVPQWDSPSFQQTDPSSWVGGFTFPE